MISSMNEMQETCLPALLRAYKIAHMSPIRLYQCSSLRAVHEPNDVGAASNLIGIDLVHVCVRLFCLLVRLVY